MSVCQRHQILISAGRLAASVLAAAIGAPITVACFGAACAVGALAVRAAFPNIRTIR